MRPELIAEALEQTGNVFLAILVLSDAHRLRVDADYTARRQAWRAEFHAAADVRRACAGEAPKRLRWKPYLPLVHDLLVEGWSEFRIANYMSELTGRDVGQPTLNGIINYYGLRETTHERV